MHRLTRLVLVALLAVVATVLVRQALARSRRQGLAPLPSPDWPAPTPPSATEPGATAPAPTGPAPAGPAPTGPTEGAWVEPRGDFTCPVSHPVKVKASSGIFHVPGGLSYERTHPDRCYASAEAAEADGFRQAKR